MNAILDEVVVVPEPDRTLSIASVWRAPRVRWSIYGGGLTALSLFTAVHMYFVYLLREPIPWSEAILSGFATWYPWLLLGPGIFWLSSRFPFEPGRWATAIAVHVPAGLVFALLHGVLRAAVSQMGRFHTDTRHAPDPGPDAPSLPVLHGHPGGRSGVGELSPLPRS